MNNDPRTGNENSGFDVRTRGENETLDEYLQNINSYLDGLNKRFGVGDGTADADNGSALDADAAENDAVETVGGTVAGDASDNVQSANSGEFIGDMPVDGFMERIDQAAGQENTSADDANDSAGDAMTGGITTVDNWQAAFANPELYPDLDALKTGGNIKNPKKKKKSKDGKKDVGVPPEFIPDMPVAGGKSKFSFVMTVINIAVYGAWMIAYMVCDICRSFMFGSAQGQMAAQGFSDYTLVISSPMFTVLKVILYLMPIVLIMWMAGVVKADKNQFMPTNKRLLIAASVIDLAVGIFAVADVCAIGLILG